MTIEELIDRLESARDMLGADAQVRVTWQRDYPIRGAVAQVTVPPEEPYAEDEQAAGQERDHLTVWLAIDPVEPPENPYGPRWAWSGRIDPW